MSVDVGSILDGLKPFQRDAVEHVFDRFYGPDASNEARRFLVADETGLGKSVVARGVIARAIEHLETVDDVQRIDIVYVCSNADLASQNLRRLNVTGDPATQMSTRLTLLAKNSARFNERSNGPGKKVNLVSFTPATSFNVHGHSAGNQEERALIALILREVMSMTEGQWRATLKLFQRSVSTLERFTKTANWLHASMGKRIDAQIVDGFHQLITPSALAAFQDVLAGMRYQRSVPNELRTRMWGLTGEMRYALAKASLNSLEPDLVILDEFQRFRDILQPPDHSEAAELAHTLFSHEAARVLLLSATPYKPYTGSDEIGEDHYRDFIQTVSFLAHWNESSIERVKQSLNRYRADLVSGRDARPAAEAARAALLPYMSRSERPHLEDGFRVRWLRAAVPVPGDFMEYANLRAFGEEIGAPIDIEYWKSIPYFANFMDGYKAGERARARFGTPDGSRSEAMLAKTRAIARDSVEHYRPVDPGNGYLRALSRETVDAGWWRLLWMPPSMPYLAPGPVYERIGDITKRLIFSAWSGVPTSVASLLSYAADQRLAEASNGLLTENTAAARRSISDRLSYRMVDGEVGALSTLALFWPHPELARVGDPLAAARRTGRVTTSNELEREIGAAHADLPPASQPWDAFFSWPGAFPPKKPIRDLITAALLDRRSSARWLESADSGVLRHADAAAARPNAAAGPRFHADLPRLAAHAPGVIAYRALRSVAGERVTEEGLWIAAFLLADSLRRLFNRPESMALLDGAYPDAPAYWSAVLSYCADGNLQSVLDEYIFQLHSEKGGLEVDDSVLYEMATECTHVLNLRPARYEAHETNQERTPIGFNARFGLRYGGRFATSAEGDAGHRLTDVRSSFNSPFAPFVLVSTSVGQEGIDFHWWSHAVVHWNLPTNPVDFEQREGRVNRFAGHAIRKNVAHAHFADVLHDDASNPWRTAFEAAERSAKVKDERLSEFAPWWVYPGPAGIERIVAQYPLSRDIERYERLRDALTLYRLTLGQPRQEDMVALLNQAGVNRESAPSIDFRPPRRRSD